MNLKNTVHLFEFKYLGHIAINSFLFQSKFFDNLVKNWLMENILNENTLSTLQKIIECMAITGRMTLEQICENMGESKYKVEKVLEEYSANTNVINIETQKDNRIFNSETMNPNLAHMLIVRKDIDNQPCKYELSLFGIMLTIAIIRYHYVGIDNIRHSFIITSSKLELFVKNIPLNDYLDKIAANYPDKLPLIFGKWDFLKKELGQFVLYNNFDFMLYDKVFSANMDVSIWEGGNKEFFDNLQKLAVISLKLLEVLYVQGRDILESFYQEEFVDNDDEFEHLSIYQKLVDNDNKFKLLPLYQKLYEIKSILKYLHNTTLHG